MNVLLIGSKGQLGFELSRTRPQGFRLTGWDLDDIDIRNAAQVNQLIGELNPRLIVNAAAYTAVDKAESEKDLAFAVNAAGAGNVADAAARTGARLLHVSTDFVFNGRSGRPYRPTDPPDPLSVYGSSKAEGEKRVLDRLGGQATVLRTSWLYSVHGRNFVKTILTRMAEGAELRIVSDQVGGPTWARELAKVVWDLVPNDRPPAIFHWSDAGVASWYDFAVAIQEEALACGLLSDRVDLRPVPSSEFPTAARRPHFSVLDTSESWRFLGRPAEHWRISLRAMLEELSSTGRMTREPGREVTGP